MNVISNINIKKVATCELDFKKLNELKKNETLLILDLNLLNQEQKEILGKTEFYKVLINEKNEQIINKFNNSMFVSTTKLINKKNITTLIESIKYEEKVRLVLCSHKDYKFPLNFIYKPTIVGVGYKDQNLINKYTCDNFLSDNISDKNQSYCELTSIYPYYKENKYEYLGLVHYRRLFMKNNKCKKKIDNVLDGENITKYLEKYDIILPKKRHYYIESNYSHYVHAHEQQPLDETRKIIEEKYPEYLSYFDKHMKATSGHYFNMLVGKNTVIIGYFDFMYDILFELEKRIDISKYNDVEKRVFGYISELLIDVYVMKNNLKVKNLKYLFFDKQNWIKKGFNFIKRKFKKAN